MADMGKKCFNTACNSYSCLYKNDCLAFTYVDDCKNYKPETIKISEMQPAIDRLNLRIKRLQADMAIFKFEGNVHLARIAETSMQSFELALLILKLDADCFGKLN